MERHLVVLAIGVLGFLASCIFGLVSGKRLVFEGRESSEKSVEFEEEVAKADSESPLYSSKQQNRLRISA